jgi:hypothetical protein
MDTAPSTELKSNLFTLIPLKPILKAPFACISVMAADGAGIKVPDLFVTNLKTMGDFIRKKSRFKPKAIRTNYCF